MKRRMIRLYEPSEQFPDGMWIAVDSIVRLWKEKDEDGYGWVDLGLGKGQERRMSDQKYNEMKALLDCA